MRSMGIRAERSCRWCVMARLGRKVFGRPLSTGAAGRFGAHCGVARPLQGAYPLASGYCFAGGSKECRLARRHRCAGVGKEYCLARQYRYAGGSHAIRIPCFTMPHETPATPCDRSQADNMLSETPAHPLLHLVWLATRRSSRWSREFAAHCAVPA